MNPGAPRLDARACVLIFCALASVNLTLDAIYIARVWAMKQEAGLEFLRSHPRLSIDEDQGLSELFEYLESGLTALALVWCAARYRVGAYVAFATAHLWLLLDNGLSVHEHVGAWIRSVAPLPSSMTISQPGGELSYFGAVGAIGVTGFWVACRKAPSAHRPMLALLGAGLLGIGFFAVGVDVVHASGVWSPAQEALVILVEDGGEALAISASLAIAAGILCGAWPARYAGALRASA